MLAAGGAHTCKLLLRAMCLPLPGSPTDIWACGAKDQGRGTRCLRCVSPAPSCGCAHFDDGLDEWIRIG